MRKLINGKVRDTDRLETVCGRSGDENDCHSSYSYLLRDERDGTYYHWSGNHWDGIGPDTLEPIADPLAFVEEQEYTLDADEASRVEELLSS